MSREATAGSRVKNVWWPIAVVVFAVAIGTLRQLWTPGFYYADDTQLGSVGQWYELGGRLLRGEIPLLSPQAWQAGNYWAEGQWGLISPLTWLIAIGTRLSSDVALWTAGVKIALLAISALGAYFLMRSFLVRQPWAALSAALVPMAGFTAYMDAASWSTGLMTSALFPWAWWTLRRVTRGRQPWPFLVASYLLIASGYVFGTIVLVALLVAHLVQAMIARDKTAVLRVVLASAWGAFWTVVIYLPGVLTAPVTDRGAVGISNDMFLNADLGDFATSASPLTTATISSWWGPVTAGPLMYVAWVLPLVVMVRPWGREMWRGTAMPVVLLAVSAYIVVAPSTLGPIRWPVRFMPYVALAALLLFAILMSRGFPERVTRSSVIAAMATGGGLLALTWALTPGPWRSIWGTFAVQIVAILILSWTARRVKAADERKDAVSRRSLGKAAVTAAAVLVVSTVGLTVLQLRTFPHTPLPVFASPTQTADLTSVLPGGGGDTFTVGDAYASAGDPASYSERLIANEWYFSDAAVSNVYTVLPYSKFSQDFCLDLRGSTCQGALPALFRTDPTTGVPLVDLLSVSRILGYRDTFPDPPLIVPAGWQITHEGEYAWTMERIQQSPPAGGVVWADEGTAVDVVDQTDSSLTFRVDSVGGDGKVVMSRLAWPGYTVDGAELSDPLRGYLLTVDVSTAAPGDEVTVTFRPPGAVLEIGAAIAALLLGLGWTVLSATRSRRGIRPQRPRVAPAAV